MGRRQAEEMEWITSAGTLTTAEETRSPRFVHFGHIRVSPESGYKLQKGGALIE